MKSEKSAITYNIGQKCAVTLCCEAEEKLGLRVKKIVEYLDKNYVLKQWAISDIEATGSYGNSLTSEFQRWYPPRDLSVESIQNRFSKILKPPHLSVGSI
jgi:hypothetical protein